MLLPSRRRTLQDQVTRREMGLPVTIGIGDTLREARESQGRSLEEAAEDTRIRGDFLRALEEERFRSFGGDIYAKGFLSTYARYLQLDPAPLLDLYREHVQQEVFDGGSLTAARAPRPKAPPPRWLSWAITAVVAVIGVVAVANLFDGRTPDPAVEPSSTGTAVGTGVPDATEPPPPSPSPTPVDDVNLTLLFEETSWVRIQIDGETIEEGTIPPGESRSLEGDDTVTVRFGNAGGVRAELNGQDLGTLGARGEVATVTFTPEGSQPA